MKTKLGWCFKANWAGIFLSGLLAMSTGAGFAAETNNYADLISQSKLFKEPIVWVGTNPPTRFESESLWSLCKQAQAQYIPDNLDKLENYIAMHPGSPWVPSLQANLAYYYRWNGRYTPALRNWEATWKATRDYKSGPGKRVADFTLAYWAQLLSSLGRLDQLERLYAEAGKRQMEQLDWRELWVQSRNNLATMKNHPEISFRCGTLALAQMASALSASPAPILSDLITMHSPDTGFSMSSLLKISEQYHLGLVAVRRVSGDELVVPSVVHWRQNHYAAIVKQSGDLFKVIDPTFGQPKWLSRDVINSEASGAFLVPANQCPFGWQLLPQADADAIYGKGIDGQNTKDHPPPCNSMLEECTNAPPCPCHSNNVPGMPTWTVDEPEISLWLEDTPMTHKTSTGKEFLLKFYYYQRETRPVSTNIFSFGPLWNCTWLTYLDVQNQSGPDPNYGTFSTTEYGAGGGKLQFIQDLSDPDGYDGTNYSGVPGQDAGTPRHPDPQTHCTISRILATNTIDDSVTLNGFEQTYPNGSRIIYGLQQVMSYGGESLFFQTACIDAHGRVSQFIYNTNNGVVLLTQVIDWDGNTNTLKYSASYPSQVSEIDGPNGSVYLSYDTNAMLTNITDVAGLSSSFQYMYTDDEIPELTTLSTPYGNTTFSYYQPEGNLFDHCGDGNLDFNRAILATQPDGGKNLYVYQEYGICTWDYWPGTYAEPLSGVPVFTNTAQTNIDGINNYYMEYHNSFYWGPKQFALLSSTNITVLSTTNAMLLTTNINLLTINDLYAARMKNWLDDLDPDRPGGLMISETLNMEQQPSLDGVTIGQRTWYGYTGKNIGYGISTNNLQPVYIAQVLPNGQTKYTYNTYNLRGYVATNVSTYSVGSSVLLRTNIYIYDTNNYADLLRIIGPDGVTNVSYGYNDHHQLLAETNALGEVTLFTYALYANAHSTNSQLTSITNPSGLVTTNVFYANGFLASTYDYSSTGGYHTNSYTFTNGLIYTHTDEHGLTVTNTWDALNRLRKVAFPDGTFITNSYDKLDLTRTVDRMGFVNSFAYDNMRRKVGWTNALGRVTSYGYCSCGALESIADPLTNITTFYYDNQGRRTEIVYPDSYTVDYNYDVIGNVTNVSDSAGQTYTAWYNMQGLLLTASNSVGRLASYNYDINDRVTNFVNQINISFGLTYDALWRPLTITNFTGSSAERYGYTFGFYDLTSYTNQLNQATHYVYDAAGRVLSQTNANNEVTLFAYNSADDLITLTDGKNQTTTWTYDVFGNVSNKVDAANNQIFVYKYDPDNRLTSRWTPAKANTVYRYDAAGNLTNIVYPVSSNIVLCYDAMNRLTNMVDGVGTATFSYNQVGQILSENGPWANDTVTYTYANRLRTALNLSQTSGSWSQSYGYDSIQRLASVSSPAGAFSYQYVGSGPSTLVSRLTLPNGASITNSYDNLGRLLSTTLKDSLLATLNSHQYAYDAGNERTQQMFTAGNFINYSYDAIGQLKAAIGKEAGGSTSRLQELFGYAYDVARNVNFRTNNALVQTFNVNSLNELTTITNAGTLTVAGTTTVPATNVTVNGLTANRYADATFAKDGFTITNGNNTFTAIGWDNTGYSVTSTVTVNLLATNSFVYDLNGNLTSDGQRGLDYDDENELMRVTATNNFKKEYMYDGLERLRIRKEYAWSGSSWTETNEIRYVYDGDVVIQQRDANNTPTLTFTRGVDLSGSLQDAGSIGGLLAMTESSGASSYYHNDGNGNVTMLINAGQLVVAKYEYDPFGNPLSTSGPMAFVNPYWYSSQIYDPDARLSHYRFRVYVPEMQRWLNRDPLEEDGGINLFQFVDNNPIKEIDPSGEDGEATPGAVPAAMSEDDLAAMRAAKLAKLCKKIQAQRNGLKRIRALQKQLKELKSPKDKKWVQKELDEELNNYDGHQRRLNKEFPGRVPPDLPAKP